MQNPTDQAEAEASIPEETGSNDSPNKNRPVAVRRKAAKRTLPWDPPADELELVSPPPPQDEDIRTRKKPRLAEPFSASKDESATMLPPLDTTVSLIP